nr:MAG TPA: hypothetical protein [Microviridae sp.]
MPEQKESNTFLFICLKFYFYIELINQKHQVTDNECKDKHYLFITGIMVTIFYILSQCFT